MSAFHLFKEDFLNDSKVKKQLSKSNESVDAVVVKVWKALPPNILKLYINKAIETSPAPKISLKQKPAFDLDAFVEAQKNIVSNQTHVSTKWLDEIDMGIILG